MSPAHNITIRAAVESDVPAIGKLGVLLVRIHYEFDTQRFIPATAATETGYRDFLGAQLNNPEGFVLVAERDAQVIGYTYATVEGWDYVSLRGPAGALHDIVVDPDHRELGAGRMLLDATVAELKKRGAPRMLLSTASQNVAAQRLFASIGFRPTMIEMTKELGD